MNLTEKLIILLIAAQGVVALLLPCSIECKASIATMSIIGLVVCAFNLNKRLKEMKEKEN
jgi:hypothetical protein